MPATIQVGGHGATFVFTEFTGPNGTGSIINPVGVVAYTSSNTGVGTVDTSGNVSAVAPGTCNIVGTDPGNGLTASDVLTVTASSIVAQSATGVLTANA
jgi:hypothetical protein